jgi:hypothetical protein
MVVHAAKQAVATAVNASCRATVIPDLKSCRFMRISARPEFERTLEK